MFIFDHQTFVLYCIVLYCIVLYCIALHCIALHCIALYCIVLYCFLKIRFLHTLGYPNVKLGSVKTRKREKSLVIISNLRLQIEMEVTFGYPE